MTKLLMFVGRAFQSSCLELMMETEDTLDEVLGRLDRHVSIVDTCERSR